MFSSVTQRLGTRFLDSLDLLVELSTLGGYGVDRQGVFALEPDRAPDPYGEGILTVGPVGESVRPASTSILAVGPASRTIPAAGPAIPAAGPASGDVTPASAGPPVFARSRGDCPHVARFSPPCRDAAARP